MGKGPVVAGVREWVAQPVRGTEKRPGRLERGGDWHGMS